MSLCPHRLYGIFDLKKNEFCSAALWRTLAEKEISKAHNARKLPILVGGTGFYVKALLEGLSPIPDIPQHIRSMVSKSLENPSTRKKLYHHLKTCDPESASKIKPEDSQRLSRALEVLIHTKKTLSFWRKQPKIPSLQNVHFRIISIMPPRDDLYAAINTRAHHMLKEGAIEEVSQFSEHQTSFVSNGLRIIGYEEIQTYLKREMDYKTLLDKIQQRTRNYAKRQRTWLRHQTKPHYTIGCLIPTPKINQYLGAISQNRFLFRRF